MTGLLTFNAKVWRKIFVLIFTWFYFPQGNDDIGKKAEKTGRQKEKVKKINKPLFSEMCTHKNTSFDDYFYNIVFMYNDSQSSAFHL